MKTKLIGVLVSVTLLSGCQSLQNSFTNDEGTNPKQEEPNGQAEEKNEEALTLSSEFFNQIEETGGKKVIQNYSNTLALVNKTYFLPESYIPGDLVRANVNYSFGDQQIEKALMRQEAATALEQMFAGAKAQGIELYAVSGYRSAARQKVLFDAEVQQHGIEKAQEAVAIPGQSEHQTGLTMDISSRSVDLLLTQEYENTAEGKWLANNAHKYGFILRYPKGKEAITGYKYEPWHFRYVGKEYAKVIFEKNLTLEEYFNLVKEI